MFAALLCWLGFHHMQRTRDRLRCCKRCKYREYLFFRGYGFGRHGSRWGERWYEYKGPTQIDVDGYTVQFDADQ